MILMVLIIPLTIILVGTMLGASAAIPALVLSAVPFYARLVEMALREVDAGVLEAADAMGASYGQLVLKVLLPESMPALISGLTVTSVTMIGFTAMAGAIGAGGLGNLAWQEGFQRNNYTVTLVATVIILVIVFIVQGVGDFFTAKLDKR
jgi:D-methionine transport system permease protein